MKPKYRPLYIVMSAAIVLFIIFFERNVGFASFTEEMFINGCMNMVMPGLRIIVNRRSLIMIQCLMSC